MVETTYHPPTCPACGANLFRVHETIYETYKFDPKMGTYPDDDGEAKMTCPECGVDLYDVFPHGVCNYVHPSKTKQANNGDQNG